MQDRREPRPIEVRDIAAPVDHRLDSVRGVSYVTQEVACPTAEHRVGVSDVHKPLWRNDFIEGPANRTQAACPCMLNDANLPTEEQGSVP